MWFSGLLPKVRMPGKPEWGRIASADSFDGFEARRSPLGVSPVGSSAFSDVERFDGSVTRAKSLSLPIAQGVIAFALLGAPLAFGSVEPWAWTVLAVLAVGALLLWAIGSVRIGTLRMAWSPLYVPGVLFVVLVLIQLYVPITQDHIATRESLYKFWTNLVFFFVAPQLWANSRGETWRRIGLTVTLYAFVLSLFAILQSLSSHRHVVYGFVSMAPRSWPVGPYVNHNHYAGLMEMLVPVAVCSFLSLPPSYPMRHLIGVSILVPLASVWLSGSRGGTISVAVESLILAVVLFRCAPRRIRRSFARLALLGLSAALALFFWIDPGQISKRLGDAFQPVRSAQMSDELEARKAFSRDCFRILRDHPWLGTGLGSFETVYPRYQSMPSDFAIDQAHDDLAQALAETGLGGGALILAAILLFLVLAFRHMRRRLERPAAWIQLGGALGCCGLLVHSSMDFNLHIPANAAWFAVCAATSSTTKRCTQR